MSIQIETLIYLYTHIQSTVIHLRRRCIALIGTLICREKQNKLNTKVKKWKANMIGQPQQANQDRYMAKHKQTVDNLCCGIKVCCKLAIKKGTNTHKHTYIFYALGNQKNSKIN